MSRRGNCSTFVLSSNIVLLIIIILCVAWVSLKQQRIVVTHNTIIATRPPPTITLPQCVTGIGENRARSMYVINHAGVTITMDVYYISPSDPQERFLGTFTLGPNDERGIDLGRIAGYLNRMVLPDRPNQPYIRHDFGGADCIGTVPPSGLIVTTPGVQSYEFVP